MLGDTAAIDEQNQQLKQNGLVLKIDDTLADYLYCKIVFNKQENKARIGQPHLIQNLERKCGDMVKSLKTYKTVIEVCVWVNYLADSDHI